MRHSIENGVIPRICAPPQSSSSSDEDQDYNVISTASFNSSSSNNSTSSNNNNNQINDISSNNIKNQNLMLKKKIAASSSTGTTGTTTNNITRCKKNAKRQSLHQGDGSDSPSRQLRSMSMAVPSGQLTTLLHHPPTSSTAAPSQVLAGCSSGTNAGQVNKGAAIKARARTNSLPNPAFLLGFSGCRDPRTCVSVRNFTTTAKGVINAGDIVRKTSVNSLMSSGSAVPLESQERRKSSVHSILSDDQAGAPGTMRQRTESLASTDSSSSSSDSPSLPLSTPPQSTAIACPPNSSYFRVVIQGDEGVGKTALCRQFSSSEYRGTYDNSAPGDGDLTGSTVVPVLLDGEESVMEFIDGADAYQQDDINVDAYIVVFSIVDSASFRVAEDLARQLRVNLGTDRAIVLVGNKTDLVRKRQVNGADAKMAATSYDCKYIETSAALNHQVDQLVVGTLAQIRLQLLPPGQAALLPPAAEGARQRSRTPSPVSFFNKLFRRNAKGSTSCEGIFMK